MKENKFGLKIKRIDMGIFDFPVYCAIGKFGKLQKYIRWKFEDKKYKSNQFVDVHGTPPAGLCLRRPGYVIVIWLPRKPKTANDYGVLAHEAFHAVRHLSVWADFYINEETNEVVAHAIKHIVKEIGDE